MTWQANTPTGQNSKSVASNQRLADATAQKHRQEYLNTAIRWDSSHTADQQPCWACERGVTWQVNTLTLAQDWLEFKVSCPHTMAH